VAAALLCATALTLAVTAASMARPGDIAPKAVAFVNAPTQPSEQRATAMAVERFVEAMSSHDADAIWMFASEEEQDAFGTESATYEAYAETFPEFTKANEITFTRFWQEGDTDFVQVLAGDASGAANVATMGFWLDDAGDWKLVSCDVTPLSDLLAGL